MWIIFDNLYVLSITNTAGKTFLDIKNEKYFEHFGVIIVIFLAYIFR